MIETSRWRTDPTLMLGATGELCARLGVDEAQVWAQARNHDEGNNPPHAAAVLIALANQSAGRYPLAGATRAQLLAALHGLLEDPDEEVRDLVRRLVMLGTGTTIVGAEEIVVITTGAVESRL